MAVAFAVFVFIAIPTFWIVNLADRTRQIRRRADAGHSILRHRLSRHGRLGYEAVLERDHPMPVALNFIVAALVLLANLVSDILHAVVDPWMRLE